VLSSVRTLHTVRAVDRFLAAVRSAHGAPAVPPGPTAESPSPTDG
jgi:hypothetical protein